MALRTFSHSKKYRCYNFFQKKKFHTLFAITPINLQKYCSIFQQVTKVRFSSSFNTDIKKSQSEDEAKCTDSSKIISTFQQSMSERKGQAQCSVLLELNQKAHIAGAVFACEKFGPVKSLHSYKGISSNVFLLLEFAEESSASHLLSVCQNENVLDAFASTSCIVRFTPKFKKDVPQLTIPINDEQSQATPKQRAKSISELIESFPEHEKIPELSTRLRFFLCRILRDSLLGVFPRCDVLPFGSSVNGFGKQGCDLDLMIRLHPLAQMERHSEFSFLNKTCVGKLKVLQGTTIKVLSDYFRTFLPGFSSVEKIIHAHVPIMKFTHKLLGLDCDVSINNMTPILMSEILHFCGQIDGRVVPLVCAVKKWAKLTSVTYEVAGNWITNFGLTLLVVFFLQNRPTPILPKLNEALRVAGADFEPVFEIQYLLPLSNLQAKASLNQESLADLLKEFLNFLGTLEFQNRHISILTGLSVEKIHDSDLWIQYPMEEDRNVTRNVRQTELYDMCDKAQLSAEYLAKNIHATRRPNMDFAALLGVPEILKYFSQKSRKRIRS